MAKFFFGNYATSSDITFVNNTVNFTAQIVVTKQFDPDDPMNTVKTYDVPLGVLTDIDVSQAIEVKAICKPLLGFKFTKAHRTNNSASNVIPFTDELMEFNFTRAMWEYATNDNPRKIGVITGASDKYKDFMFGNSATGAGVISQNGEPTYKAYVDVTTNTGVAINEIPLGIKTYVNVLGATAVNVRCVPLVNNQFLNARTGSGSIATAVPFEPELINVALTNVQWAGTSIARRQFVINTERVVTRIFYFGNDVDITGKPIKTGANSFKGVVTLYGEWDAETPDVIPEKTYNVESGTELGLILTPSFSKGKIDLTVVDGFEFTGVNFPYEATYTNNTVSYNFPVDKEELNPSDEMNRYYIVTTKTTGGIDPEPSDDPITIANNYLVTKEELADFNKQIYNITGFEKTENASTLITEYISAIRIYPFILPPENLYNRGVIKVKRSELNTATIINSDIITVDLGNINIARKYNNALDFINVKPELILPFCNGSISIDPEYLLGSTVNIQMKIDIISGNATINLKSDLIDGIFEVKADSIGGDYPFYGRSDIIQKTFEPSQAINNIVTAYIILETPIYTGSIKSKKEGLLTGVKGDVIIDRIKLNVLATTSEKDDLQYLLKNGVFIK